MISENVRSMGSEERAGERRLRLGLVQMEVIGGEPQANLRAATEWVERAVKAGAEMVLLPEALDCGWTHPSARRLAGAIPGGEACDWLCGLAARLGIHLCAGLVESEGDRLFNAAVLVDGAGRILLKHRKIHELDIAHELYARGGGLGVVTTRWGRLGVHVCADAFAPGLSLGRALGQMGAKLILSPCSWAVPPGYDQQATPYGGLWRESYGPVCREFGLWTAGCSHVGALSAGPWAGWRAVGCSMVVGPTGDVELQAPYDEVCVKVMEIGLSDPAGW